jgi:hypothetical protein
MVFTSVFEHLFSTETSLTRVAAQVVSGIGFLEQIVGRLSLEPSVTAARWRVETSIE